MSPRELLLVAAGGAVGAVLRYLTGHWLGGGAVGQGAFPLATLAVNVVGSFALGVVAGLLAREAIDPAARQLVAVGLLGALTTFSTFGLETVQLLAAGQGGTAALSVAANLALALGAAWAGLHLAS